MVENGNGPPFDVAMRSSWKAVPSRIRSSNTSVTLGLFGSAGAKVMSQIPLPGAVSVTFVLPVVLLSEPEFVPLI